MELIIANHTLDTKAMMKLIQIFIQTTTVGGKV